MAGIMLVYLYIQGHLYGRHRVSVPISVWKYSSHISIIIIITVCMG